MCSRFTQTEVGPLLDRLLGPQETAPPARYNIAPSQEAVAIRGLPERGLVSGRMRFGWPHPGRSSGLLLNARAETASEKFREALTLRRAVVPADGFYEWSGSAAQRRPWLIRRRDRQPFALAALWSAGPGDSPSFVLLTIPPNEVVAPIHHRMPLVLPLEACRRWLDPVVRDANLQEWSRPPAPMDWEVVPVSRRVNRTDRDDPSLWIPDPEAPTLC